MLPTTSPPDTGFPSNASDATLAIPDETTPFFKHYKVEETDLVFEPTWIDYKAELTLLFFNAAPNIAAYFLQAAMPLASVFAIGHLGSLQLGAAALSNMFAAITGWSLSIGMASSLDTLCSQSFTGSKDPRDVGLHLQRGILVSMVMFVPISLVWWNSELLMLLLRQDPELSRLCGLYMRVLLLGAPPYMIFECLKKFLQAQRIMKAQTYIIVSILPLNFLLNYLLILNPVTSIGFAGAPLTSVLTFWIMAFLGVLYIGFVDGSKCWGGWSRQALTGWKVYIKLGIPGILQICSEWWAFEIMSLAASYLGTSELAAQSVVTSITNAFFSIAIGQAISASSRLGNLLGAGMPNRAKLSSRCSVLMAILLPNISVFILLFFSQSLGSLFTNDKDVLRILQKVLPVVSLYQIFDSVGTVCGGVLRGQGRQNVGAIVNLFAFYGLAIPLGLYAAFQLEYSVIGLWYGTALALSVTSSSLAIFVFKTDWNAQVAACQARLNEVATPIH